VVNDNGYLNFVFVFQGAPVINVSSSWHYVLNIIYLLIKTKYKRKHKKYNFCLCWLCTYACTGNSCNNCHVSCFLCETT